MKIIPKSSIRKAIGITAILGLGSLFIYPILSPVESQETSIEEDFVPPMDTSRDHEGDTFSVVAYDPITQEIGGAGTSCYSGNINFLNDIIFSPGGTLLGAIHTQAAYTSCNQGRARTRMLAGDTPAQIITYMQSNDCGSGPGTRQYGIVGIDSGGNITTAGYTGNSNGNWAGNITGIDPNTGMHYAIQGNILDTSTGGGGRQDILDDMETAFRNSTGTLADKLMAALQGAKRVGGDNRCVNSGNSGRASFVRVQNPSDPIGNPSMDLWTYPNISLVEPIDILQCDYDAAVSTPYCRTTINTFPYSMDFETKSWEQETATCSTYSSWIRSRFTSPSGNTGPASSNQGALYTFVEASNINSQGTSPRNAILGSPCFDIPTNHTAQMTFDYHMYGADMGTLSVQGSDDNGSSWTTLWTLSGNQGNSWTNDETIDLSSYSGSTVKLRLNALMGNGFASDMAVDDIQITVTPIPGCSAVKTWDGTNWSPAGAPSTTDIVAINGNYTTGTHGNLDACSLTINPGFTLTVSQNGYLNVDGDIDVLGTLDIKKTGSLVQVDPTATVDNLGTITVDLETPPLKQRDFMILGSPMTTETRTGVFTNAYNVQEYTSGNFIPHPGIPAGGTNFLDDDQNAWNPASGSITPGEGYLVYPQASYNDPAYGGDPLATIVFDMTYTQGTLNNGTVTRPITFNGLGSNPDGTPNVLANPYASPIDASALVADNALINEVYFWEHLTTPNSGIPGPQTNNFSMDDISMYNGTMGVPAANDPGTSTMPNGVISTGQGFGIKAFGAGSIDFNNSMRLTSGNTTLRTPEGLEKLVLKVRNEQYELGSYTGIGFRPDGTAQLDDNMDSNRLATVVSLYSHLEDGSEQLGIQTRESFDDEIKIPIGFASQVEDETTYVISIAGLEGSILPNTTIYLVDNQEHIITNLTQGNYEFKSNKGIFNARFTIQFEQDGSLGFDQNKLNSIAVYPNPATDILNIVSEGANINSVEVYDLRGRRVSSFIDNKQDYVALDVSSFNTGVYFVKINTDAGEVTKKIIKK